MQLANARAPAWSQAHLEDDPATVGELLGAALGRLLTGGAAPRWHHRSVHRWRYAMRAEPGPGDTDHPIALPAHDWRITGLDVNRGYDAADLSGPSFSAAAVVPAAVL